MYSRYNYRPKLPIGQDTSGSERSSRGLREIPPLPSSRRRTATNRHSVAASRNKDNSIHYYGGRPDINSLKSCGRTRYNQGVTSGLRSLAISDKLNSHGGRTSSIRSSRRKYIDCNSSTTAGEYNKGSYSLNSSSSLSSSRRRGIGTATPSSEIASSSYYGGGALEDDDIKNKRKKYQGKLEKLFKKYSPRDLSNLDFYLKKYEHYEDLKEFYKKCKKKFDDDISIERNYDKIILDDNNYNGKEQGYQRGSLTSRRAHRRKQQQTLATQQTRAAVGLINLGNTCYMNTAIQCICSTPMLISYFNSEDKKWVRDINPKSDLKGKLAKTFGSVINRLSIIGSGSSENTVRPQALKSVIARLAPQFGGYRQHDCHELLRFLLDGLHEELNRVKKTPPYEQIEDKETDTDEVKSRRWWKNYADRNDSVLVDTFAGQLKSVVTCRKCGHISTAFDPFWDLSLPIISGSSKSSSSYYYSSSGRQKVELKDCLTKFCDEEELEAYYCSKCKKHRQSTKKLSVFKFPNVLVIHLKRFEFRGYSRSKIQTHVVAPKRLEREHLSVIADIKSASAENHINCSYGLYAIANHMGTCNGGHYKAHANIGPGIQDDWRCFNDSRVSSTLDTSAGQGSSAYVLFYRKIAGNYSSGLSKM
mmetsp:Transcript_35393/g.57340  ORF Transcript_35393/g.57340 Transcript_35393/m.57340 type:complete len:645 (+) Transcript_35393:221-2155(+)